MTFSTMMERLGGSFHLGVASGNIEPSSGSQRRRELLAIMPTREDHIVMIGIFAGTGWKVRFAGDLESAYEILCRNPIGVVLYSRDVSGLIGKTQ